MRASLVRRAVGHASRVLGAAALTAFAALPLRAYFLAEPSIGARALVASLAALSAAFPGAGLVTCAGLLPLAGPIGLFAGTGLPWSFVEPLVLALLGGCAFRALLAVLLRRSHPPTEVHASARPQADVSLVAAGLLALVAVCSSIVGLFAIQPAIDTPAAFVRDAIRYLHSGVFSARDIYDVIPSGLEVLEGCGLFAAAVVLVGRDRGLADRVFRATAWAGTGVAALNIVRLLTVWERSGGAWTSLGFYLQTVRATAAFPDVNSCGSYLALVLLLVGGFVCAGLRRRGDVEGGRILRASGIGWLTMGAIVALGLWLTGSRAALAAVVPAAFVLWPARPPTSRWLTRTGVVVVLGLIIVPTFFAWDRFSPSAGGRAVRNALDYRVRMTRVGLRMFVDHPAFGVGIGRFYPESGAYLGTQSGRFPPRENAHNNFLQVLAELGLVGFLPFLLLQCIPAVRVTRLVSSGQSPPRLLGAAAGLVAFVLTWFAGHPMLVAQVASAFWILLGTVTAAAARPLESPGDAPAGEARRRAGIPTRTFALAFAALVVVSVPLRGLAAAPRINVQSLAVGLSGWESDQNAERFRTLERSEGRFYVPSDATSLRLPLRLAPGADAGAGLEVSISVDGVLVSRVRVDGATWRDAAFLMPRTTAWRPFHTVQVSVAGAGNAEGQPACRLQLGKPTVTRRSD